MVTYDSAPPMVDFWLRPCIRVPKKMGKVKEDECNALVCILKQPVVNCREIFWHPLAKYQRPLILPIIRGLICWQR
jgi:hypothetical protein